MSEPQAAMSSVFENKFSYRPDIDGLRAVAVLSVILFHIDKRLLPGGFVGVDIFFVISGFLISLHILQEVEAGRFSIADFYRRRVKRIAPAMLVVVLATMAMAQFVLIPEDAKRTADSALWSLASLANVYFWLNQDTDYFAAASSELPLLHLWSLGVEEQFYILWPLLLMGFYRRGRAKAFFALAALTALVSFGFGQIWFARDPSFVYYMLPTRAGELLLGALVAMAALRGVGQRLPSVAFHVMAVLGCLLVAGSLFLLAEDQVFPGLLAIPPTLGAALLIMAGLSPQNGVSRMLAVKPLVWIGMVSYSAYLWHWPLLAFFRYGHAEVGMLPGVAILGITFLLASLSYRLVERPARKSNASVIRVFLVQYIAPGAAIAAFAFVAIHVQGYGLRWKSKEYIAQLAAFQNRTRPAYAFDYVCQRWRISAADVRNERCVLGADVPRPARAILWGDSNAAHYVGLVAAIGREAGFRFRNVAASSCPPLIEDPAPFVPAKRVDDCRASVAALLPELRAADVVMISGAWTEYARHSGRFFDSLFATVRSLSESGKLVILMGKAPVIAGYDRRCREKALSYPMLECAPSVSVPPAADVLEANARLKAFAVSTPNVAYYDVSPYLCHDGLCSALDASGHPLYYDPSHLSLAASWEIGDAIVHQEGVPEPFRRVAGWPHRRESLVTVAQ
ncbi:MAG: acyltransferase family protein [Betaproteobacteria bacterium]